MRRAAMLWFLAGALLHAQSNRAPIDELGKMFLAHTWNIDGESDRPALAVDPKAGQLWILHRRSLQIVDLDTDLETGKVIKEIGGFYHAEGIAFDDIGEFAYISDTEPATGEFGVKPGMKCSIKVVDRRMVQVVATIPLAVPPKNVWFDPWGKLLFVLPDPSPPDAELPGMPHRKPNKTTSPSSPSAGKKPSLDTKSVLTVIDTEQQKVIGQISISGRVDSAQSDGMGTLYITVSDRNQILAIDEGLLLDQLKGTGDKDYTSDTYAALDWSDRSPTDHPESDPLTRYDIAPVCKEPKGLAVAWKISRVFVACGDGKLAILNTGDLRSVGAFSIDPATDNIAYDADRGLLYVPNQNGSLTVISRHVANDTYVEVLNLLTVPKARSLALNPDTGQLYLVTDKSPMDMTKADTNKSSYPSQGIERGGFQVLVIGH